MLKQLEIKKRKIRISERSNFILGTKMLNNELLRLAKFIFMFVIEVIRVLSNFLFVLFYGRFVNEITIGINQKFFRYIEDKFDFQMKDWEGKLISYSYLPLFLSPFNSRLFIYAFRKIHLLNLCHSSFIHGILINIY